nr:hypothetical protein [uncultured Desulfovibrio sp.]
MPIRIQQYATSPRRVQVGGIDPGFQQALIRHVGQDAAASTTQALLDAGKQLTEVGIKEYVSQETARVSQALQDYKAQLSAEQERYTTTNQGQNALDAGRHFDRFAREAAAPLAEKFSGKFRTMFMQDAAAFGLRFTEQGQAYAGQQEKAWKKSQWDGDVAQTMDSIAQDPGNKDFIETALGNLKGRYAEMFPGMDYRAVDAEINHKAAGIIIDSFLAKEDVGHARGAFEQYKGILGAAAPQYEARIKSMGRELQARAEAQAEKAKSRTALEAARSLMETYGGDTQQALAAIAEQTNNVEDRLRVTQSYMTLRNIDDAAQAQVRQEKTIADQNNILAQIKAAGSDPTALNAIIADAAPEHKQFALVHAEQALGKQPPAFSEPQAWAEANTAILNGERYEIVAGRYAGRLAKADMQELKTLAGKEDKQNEKEWKLYFDRIWSTSSHARITDTADRNQNKNQLEYEVARRLRGVTDPQKARDIIFDLVHDRQVPGFFGWRFGGSPITSIESRAYNHPEKMKIAVPDEARKLIEKQAEEDGRELTEDDIVSTFLRNRNKFGY